MECGGAEPWEEAGWPERIAGEMGLRCIHPMHQEEDKEEARTTRRHLDSYLRAKRFSVCREATPSGGVKSKVFGEEGLFLATLTNNDKTGVKVVYLQSLPLRRRAKEIVAAEHPGQRLPPLRWWHLTQTASRLERGAAGRVLAKGALRRRGRAARDDAPALVDGEVRLDGPPVVRRARP